MSGRGASASSNTQADNNAANAATTAVASSGQATEQGQQRDGQGRFAGKEQTPAPGPAENASAQPAGGKVPIQALDAERGKRKEIEERHERELKELRDQIAALSKPQPTRSTAPLGARQARLMSRRSLNTSMRLFARVSIRLSIRATGSQTIASKARLPEFARCFPMATAR